jgi:hypothetical protein
MPTELQKWDVLRLWWTECNQPHFKYCICLCPINKWFMAFHSDRPLGRKARDLALTVSSFQATFLDHTSYIDTTHVEQFQDGRVETALTDPKCHYGPISPTLQGNIKNSVAAHRHLTDIVRQAILN